MWSRYSRLVSQRSSLSSGQMYRDLLETHNQSLGFRQLEGVKIDCSFLPDSKWGFLGNQAPGDPAWLLYLQLQFSQPDDCKLAKATVELTFEKTNAPNVKQIYGPKPGPVLTQYYGPRDVTRSHFNEGRSSVTSLLDGAGTMHTSEWRPQYQSDSSSQWSLRAYTWPVEGDDSGLHRRVEWIIKEACAPYQTILHQDQVRVGLVILHDSDPFMITVRIEGQLQGSHGWFKFPSLTETSIKSASVRVSPSAHELVCLDKIAENLNEDMTARILRHLRERPYPSKRARSDDGSDTDETTKKPRVHRPNTMPTTLSATALLKSHEDYTIGWICALPVEMAAARAMLDEIHDSLPNPLDDHNNYILGNIGLHNIVVACLPAGIYGITSATTVATQMIATFRSIRISLMVGIGGGVPSSKNDIRLGDVVVSKPTGRLGGVVQYDSGKTTANGNFEQTGILDKPPQALLTTAAKMQAEHMVLGNRIADHLAEMEARFPGIQKFACPGQEKDRLFSSEYDHDDKNSSCDSCDPSRLIHYGIIASGSQVMKHGKARDRISQEHGIICFEMEAAGLMDHFPCLVIRGICDYADSHKNDDWHGYAAATAAAYAKEFISKTPVRMVEVTPRVADVQVPIQLALRIANI
ncbi:nucleoside phosphorylase domain-containing protein [Aspergillus similis]